MAKTKTVAVRLPENVAKEASTWGKVFTGKGTLGDVLAEAWYEYLADHDEELDRLEDEARAKRKEMARRRPKPDGGKTYA